MILGKTFGLMTQDKIGENLKMALAKIIHNTEDLKYWAKVSNFEQDSPVYRYLSQHALTLAQNQKSKIISNNQPNYAIPAAFSDAVEELNKNIFAYHWLGLMQSEMEKKNKTTQSKKQQKQVDLKKTAPISSIDYLTYAADGFCDLSLNFLSTIKIGNNSQKIFDKIKKAEEILEIMNTYNQADASSALNAFIIYLIQNNLFSKEQMLSFGQKSSLLPINNMRKLTSSLIFDGSPFQKSYQDCYDTLYSKMSAERNKSFFSTEDLMWKCTTIGYPCFVMGLNAYLLNYYVDDAHTKSFKDNLILSAQKGLFTISASLVTFSVSAYVMYNRSIFSRLGEDIVNDEVTLMALYLASKPSEQESYKIRAEKIYNQLYRTAAGFRTSLLPRISQIAIDYEEKRK